MTASSNHRLGLALQRLLTLVWFVAVPVAVAVVLLFAGILVAGGHVRLELPVSFSYRPALAAPSGALAALSGTVRGRVSTAQGLLAVGFIAAELAIGLTVLRQLRAVVADTAGGTPFDRRSPRRLRLIGVLIIAAELVRSAATLLASLWARRHVHIRGVHIQTTVSVQWVGLLAGIVVVVVAEAFRIGHELQQEHDLTI